MRSSFVLIVVLEITSCLWVKCEIEDTQQLTCQPNIIRHFGYNSLSDLWGENGGSINIFVSLVVHTLGAENDNSDACKFLVEIAEIEVKPILNGTARQSPILRRSKRGVSEWFQSAWKKVKSFFRWAFNMDSPETKSESVEERSPPIQWTTTTTTTTTQDPNLDMIDDSDVEIFDPSIYKGVYDTPFEFVQLKNGSVNEIRFASNDTDESVRNFKRHLADIFSTHFNKSEHPSTIEEETLLGKHNSSYSSVTTPAPYTTTETSSQILTVTSRMSANDIMSLTPVEQKEGRKDFNNLKNLDLNTLKVQKYSEGELILAEGELDLSMNEIDSKRRKKRNANHKESVFGVKTKFTFQLNKRRKREIIEERNVNDLEKRLNFISASMMTTPKSGDTLIRDRMESLLAELGDIDYSIRMISDPQNTNIITSVLELLELNSKLKSLPKKCQICDTMKVLLSETRLKDICAQRPIRPCSVSLMIAASVGGIKNQQTLLSLFRTWSEINNVNEHRIAQLLYALTLVPDPSVEWTTALVDEISLLSKENRTNALSLISSISTIILRNSIPVFDKITLTNKLGETLISRIQKCAEDDISMSLIQAIGTTKLWNKYLIILAKKCKKSDLYKKTILGALESSLSSPKVINWILQEFEISTCTFKKDLADILLLAAKNSKYKGDDQWPLTGFNEIDQRLKMILISNKTDQSSCAATSIYSYFLVKYSKKSGEAIELYDSMQLINSPKKRVRRSSFWDDEACDDWSSHREGSKEPLDGYEENGQMYNRWRHCSAHQSFGKSMARAEFNGGMFAGVKYPSDPPHFKVQAKLNGDATFLGKQYDVGTISFSIDENRTNAYVKLLGRTILNLDDKNCNEDDFIYRPATQIPLYLFNVWLIEISLGIYLGVDASVKFECPPSVNVFKFNPSSKIRVAGEASGRVLMLKGGINLGGNFNYHLKTKLQPYPEACFSAKQEFEPMSISINTWYQFLLPITGWSGRHRWNPSFLDWSIGPGLEENWMRYYCIIPEKKLSRNGSET